MAIKDSAPRKIEQETNLRKIVEVKPPKDKSQTIFDRISKGQMEPKVNPSQLAPLNKSRTEIFSLCKNVLHLPLQLQAPANKRDRSKWWDFHNNHGHHTKACKDLVQEIEGYIKHRLLQQYIVGPRPSQDNKLIRGGDQPRKCNRQNVVDKAS